ncbi:MAG: apolipoprotein N-acyltransferase [Thermodesulfobacteriota bacterium]
MRGRYIAAISSGLLLIFSFAPFGLWPLAFVAFVPLMRATSGQKAGYSFFLGLISGLVFFIGTVYWVVHSMYFYGGLGLIESLPVMLLLAAYLALFFAFFSLFSRYTPPSPSGTLFFLPCLWVALEYLRAHLFTGFPWVLAGYSQAHNLILLQMADITGVWGLSFMVILVNTCIYILTRSYGRARPFPAKVPVITVTIVAVVSLYGILRIKQVESAVRSWPVARAAVAQGNIDQAVKWDKSYQAHTLRIYRALTERAASRGAELVVWPETAVPFYLEKNEAGFGVVTDIAVSENVTLLTGSPAFDYNKKTGDPRYYNSAYVISSDGRIGGRYDKVHLVPYGEYVPLKRFMPFVKKLTAGVGDFVSGPGPVPLEVNGFKAGLLICYEAIFPALSRISVRDGAGILVNITNDGWFGRTSAPYQHLDMTLVRAVENRIFLLRAANTGISAVISPVGKLKKRTKLFTGDVLVEEVSIKDGEQKTFYTAYGDIFAYVSLAFAGLVIVFGRGRRRSL